MPLPLKTEVKKKLSVISRILEQIAFRAKPANPVNLSVAVFGKSGTGKTVLLASFFGYHQDDAIEEANGYSLSVSGLQEGNELLSIYHNIQEKGFLNSPGSRRYRKYIFKLGIPKTRRKALLEWHDYPGGWLENTPRDREEAEERQRAFARLINCHVAFLLIDGLELSNYDGPKAKYIGYTIDQFKHAFRNIYDGPARPVLLPKIWVLCVSKSDLLPGYSCNDFHEDINQIRSKLRSLRSTLKAAAQAPDIKFSLGEHFLLLSSAHIDKAGNVVDPNQKAGIDLITPLGLRLPLMYKYRYQTLIDNIVALGTIPATAMVWLSTDIAGAGTVFGVALKAALTLGAAQLTRKAREAKERKKSVEAVFLTMLERLQIAEDSGAVYFHDKTAGQDEDD